MSEVKEPVVEETRGLDTIGFVAGAVYRVVM